MDAAVSRKLHALRFFAALLVVAAHISQQGYTGLGHGLLESLGRLGVIVFFVLSGYVIAYVSDVMHLDFKDFMIARFARLHSVLVPALAITLIADAIGSTLVPEIYAAFPSPRDPRAVATAPAFVLFLNQSVGHGGLRWLSNSPLWSIAYEFWYYVLYGAVVYLRGAARWLTLAAASVTCGTKILLLWPLWLAGVALYRKRSCIEAIPAKAVVWAGAAGVLGLILLCLPQSYASLAGLREWGVAMIGLNFSGYLPWDLLLLPPICMVMLAIIQPHALAPNDKAGRYIAWLAGGTFSIYSYHLPLLLLARSTGAYDTTSPSQAVLAGAAVVAASLMLSLFTERRKRPWQQLWAMILRAQPRK